jgi:hypothetical protein
MKSFFYELCECDGFEYAGIGLPKRRKQGGIYAVIADEVETAKPELRSRRQTICAISVSAKAIWRTSKSSSAQTAAAGDWAQQHCLPWKVSACPFVNPDFVPISRCDLAA